MTQVESTVERHRDKAAWFIRHKAEIHDETYYVYHYQEERPSPVVLEVLREDAKIKFQLTEGDMSRG